MSLEDSLHQNYNPTKRNSMYSMYNMPQTGQITKPHMDLMITQMSIKEGIRRFSNKGIVEWGFKLNEYVPCVANNKMNGKQCKYNMVCRQPKISHVNRKVVKNMVKELNKTFRKYIPLTTTNGKELEYSVMTLDYSTKEKVKISIHEYVENHCQNCHWT